MPYVPLDPKGWRMAMGLRPLDETKWLEVDANRDAELKYKAELLQSHYDTVVATTPQSYEACEEVLELAEQSLRVHHPELVLAIDNDENPLVRAARLVQEDLCVLQRSDQWRLTSAVVCFPSRWNLASKIGRTMDEIHGPIPLYADKLASPTNAFFDRISPDKSVWRLNWTLIDNADLHQPTAARKSPEGDLHKWFFRVERQTLRMLPETRAILFTIRNYVASAAELCERDENFGPTLLTSLETAPLEMQEYKGWIGVAEKLRASLMSG